METSKENSIMLRFRYLRENLEESDKKFGQLALNTQVVGQIQKVDLDTIQIAIRTTMVASTSLWNYLQEPIWKASPSGMTHDLREHDPKHTVRVQDSRPVVEDSSTTCTRPSLNSGETATIESQGVVNPVPLGLKRERLELGR
ncbi:UNVERIFIED_CONTAM: hypothetical protein Sangu_2611900 [Sesamum angustifolium]|uniref:Uncharacterized protein n=1 Tax=Sesamum angustifolium TaxID=2727405 RepID=A0AAW2J6W4_9LAMI